MGWLKRLMAKKKPSADSERLARLKEEAEKQVDRSKRLTNAALRYAEREGTRGQYYNGS